MIQKWSSQHFMVIIVSRFQSFHGRDFFLHKFENTRERWNLIILIHPYNSLSLQSYLTEQSINSNHFDHEANFCWENFKLKYILWNYHGKNIKNLNPQRRKTLCYSTKLPREIQFEYLHLCSTLLFCSLHNPYHHYMPLRTKQI